MTHTADDLSALQTLLDRSFAAASEHLRSIMTPERRLSAERLVAALPCPAVLNIATVTARGEPRVSAVDGHFLRGHWYWTTATASPKARQLDARPAISVSFTPRDGFGVFAHGTATRLGPRDERDVLIEHYRDVYGMGPDDWGTEVSYVRVDASWLVAFAMTDAEIAQLDAERAARRGS